MPARHTAAAACTSGCTSAPLSRVSALHQVRDFFNSEYEPGRGDRRYPMILGCLGGPKTTHSVEEGDVDETDEKMNSGELKPMERDDRPASKERRYWKYTQDADAIHAGWVAGSGTEPNVQRCAGWVADVTLAYGDGDALRGFMSRSALNRKLKIAAATVDRLRIMKAGKYVPLGAVGNAALGSKVTAL